MNVMALVRTRQEIPPDGGVVGAASCGGRAAARRRAGKANCIGARVRCGPEQFPPGPPSPEEG